jgi:predicted MFS family arabinose efflux permease
MSLRGAAAFFAAAAVARLGVAMTGLAVLWTVRGSTASFAAAGVTAAVFALAQATVCPQVARLVEDRGQRRILPWSTTVFVLAVTALIVAARLRLPLGVFAVLAMTAGASIPQVGALSAARWRHAVRTPDQIAAALSLEAALNDVTFLCGPVLVTTLSTMPYPAAGLTLAGTLVAIGMTAFIWQRRSEPPAHGGSDRRLVDRRPVAPILIPAAVLLQRTTDPRVYTQAMTWMNSASAAGIAVAAPLAGLVIQIGGWQLGCLVAAGLTAALPALTVRGRPLR